MDSVLNFLRDVALSKLLVFLGICAIWIAITGNVRYWILFGKVVGRSLGTIEKILSGVFGAILVILGLAMTLNINLFPANFVQGYLGPALIILFGAQAVLTSLLAGKRLSDVRRACSELEKQSQGVVVITEKGIKTLTSSIVDQAAAKLAQHADDLKEAERHLVAHVEDATRRVLKGVPEIFDRAYKLIQNADSEIWMVNFMLQFGQVHCANQLVVDTYATEFGRDFASDVKLFYERLQIKVQEIPIVNILTVSDEMASAKFLEPLLSRQEYVKLGLAKTLENMRAAKTYFKTIIPATRKDKEWKARQYKIYELPSLPIQLLIAGLKPEDGGSERRFGCLVFMVGSESLSGVESGQESGFYTELEPMVLVMKNLASALMRSGDTVYDERPNLQLLSA